MSIQKLKVITEVFKQFHIIPPSINLDFRGKKTKQICFVIAHSFISFHKHIIVFKYFKNTAKTLFSNSFILCIQAPEKKKR